MADDEPKGATMLAQLDFGTYIAFFLPGALGLYALVPLSARVHNLFDQIVAKDTTVGATFLLITGGLVVGTVISGLRAALLDWLIVWHKPNFNFESLKDKDTRIAYKETIANTYRFYQFYGNMFLALSFYVAVKYFFGGVDYQKDLPMLSLDVLVLFGLLVQSRKSLTSTHKVVGQILGLEKSGPKIRTKKLPVGAVDQPYKCSLEAKDGVPPIKWTVVGALPAGIVLDSCGGLSGVSSAAVEVKITLRIEDANKESDSNEFLLKIV
jgi:hypothetical protein